MAVLPFVLMITIHAFWERADDSIWFNLFYYMSFIGWAQSLPF